MDKLYICNLCDEVSEDPHYTDLGLICETCYLEGVDAMTTEKMENVL